MVQKSEPDLEPSMSKKSMKDGKSAASFFPSTHASFRGRGSSAGADLEDLDFTDDTAYSTFGPNSGRATPSRLAKSSAGLADVGKSLESPELLKIEEWLSLEARGEYLGKRKHFLRLINTLDYDEKLLEVSNFMTVNDVIRNYQDYNTNCRNYLWKNIYGNRLDHHKSLGENGLVDNSLFTDETGLDHFPTILLYFKDGFEDEPPMRLDISVPVPTGIDAPCKRNY